MFALFCCFANDDENWRLYLCMLNSYQRSSLSNGPEVKLHTLSFPYFDTSKLCRNQGVCVGGGGLLHVTTDPA